MKILCIEITNISGTPVMVLNMLDSLFSNFSYSGYLQYHFKLYFSILFIKNSIEIQYYFYLPTCLEHDHNFS